MLVLQHGHLAQLTRQLERSLPFSSSIYHFAREQLVRRFQWPGVSFVVDAFPDFSVCIARTCCSSEKEVAPFVDDVGVFIHSTNYENLRTLLNSPQCLDWNRRIYFRVVNHPSDSNIVVEKCKSMDGTVTVENPAVCVSFDLMKTLTEWELPDGFKMGELNEEHAKQLVQDRNFGCPKLNLLFYRYILKYYPSAAIFQQGSEVPVAYIAYRPEGCLALGYTNPEHRGKGFMRILISEMLQKLKQLGFTHTSAYAAADNYASVKGMQAAGGVIVEGYQPDFIQYIPNNWSEEECLLRFQT